MRCECGGWNGGDQVKYGKKRGRGKCAKAQERGDGACFRAGWGQWNEGVSLDQVSIWSPWTHTEASVMHFEGGNKQGSPSHCTQRGKEATETRFPAYWVPHPVGQAPS